MTLFSCKLREKNVFEPLFMRVLSAFSSASNWLFLRISQQHSGLLQCFIEKKRLKRLLFGTKIVPRLALFSPVIGYSGFSMNSWFSYSFP